MWFSWPVISAARFEQCGVGVNVITFEIDVSACHIDSFDLYHQNRFTGLYSFLGATL